MSARAAAPAIDIFARRTDGRLGLDRYEIAGYNGVFDTRRSATALPPRRLDAIMTTRLLTTALIDA